MILPPACRFNYFELKLILSIQVLIRGQVYLNTSLTEAFGISIIEAACAGLFVVSTRVGGVPEILPDDMIEFARADQDGKSHTHSMPTSAKQGICVDVKMALHRAIEIVRSGKYDPQKAHERVKGMYSWEDVAGRTEKVYDRAMATPQKDTFERLSRYRLR